MVDWVRNKSDEQAVDNGCTFDLRAADRVRFFFERFLRHSKGVYAKKKFELLDWQWNDLVAPLFGWRRKDGTRRYRRAYVEIPKKNGKSTIAAGIALYMLMGDNEAGAEVYSAASDRDQASIVFNEALNMVRSSPALANRLEPVPSSRRLFYHRTLSVYRALSADVPTKEGLNASCVVFDELHAQRTRSLFSTLKYAGAARAQPLFFMITTAGYDRKSICWEQHQYAKGVLERGGDDSYFAYIRAADEKDDWKEEAVWQKANPSYGVTIKADDFAEAARDAAAGPQQENEFKRYRLNLWTEQETRWLSMDDWDSCNGSIDRDALLGQPCYAGLDLSSTVDLSAFVLWFAEQKAVLPFFWLPEKGLSRRARLGKQSLEAWVGPGLIELTKGNVVDYDHLRKCINELGKRYDIRGIAVDRWNSTQLQVQLAGDGFDVVQYGQGFASMTAPSKELERMLVDEGLQHMGHPVLRWMASNATADTSPAGDIKPTKAKSQDKIDGIVALIMGIGLAIGAKDDTFSGEVEYV